VDKGKAGDIRRKRGRGGTKTLRINCVRKQHYGLASRVGNTESARTKKNIPRKVKRLAVSKHCSKKGLHKRGLRTRRPEISSNKGKIGGREENIHLSRNWEERERIHGTAGGVSSHQVAR